MSKTLKIILIVAGVLIIGGLCTCVVMTGGVFTLAAFLPTSTPTPGMPAQAPPAFTPRPTAIPPTAAPPAASPAPVDAETNSANLLAPEAGLQLDGVDMKVFSVRYSLINGGEDGAFYISGDDGYLFIVTLDSYTKKLDFVYNKYFDTMKLVDLDSGESFTPVWANWSMDDSPTNSGYVKISFQLKQSIARPALYFDDKTAVDLTSLLPQVNEVENPWWDTKQKFGVYGIDIKVQSVTLAANYTSPDGNKFEKKKAADKILTVRFTSAVSDMSGLQDWEAILINPNADDDPYYIGYSTWTTAENTGQGIIEISFEVPPELNTFVIYLPYDNLMDLTAMVKKK